MKGSLDIPLRVFFGSQLPGLIDPEKGDCISISYKKIAKMVESARSVAARKRVEMPSHIERPINQGGRRLKKLVWRARHG